MKSDASKFWRATGDYAAFSTAQWEFQSRLYLSAARQLRRDFTAQIDSSPFEAIACLVVAQFNISLALELICKALYLKQAQGPREAVYTHQVVKLLPAEMLSQEQEALLNFAAQNVEWAGRYPTPKWDREASKEKYDVPEIGEPNAIDGNDLPNRASITLIDAMEVLYDHIHQA
jgi:hypothetical protein